MPNATTGRPDSQEDADAWFHADRLAAERAVARELATAYVYTCPRDGGEVDRDFGGRAACLSAACGWRGDARDARRAV